MPEVADGQGAAQRRSSPQLVTRAQEEGSLRRDIDPEDVPVLVGSAIIGSAQAADPEAWRRYVAVVLDGLRSPA